MRTPQDLINIGLEKELASVFNTYLHTDKYSKELLQKIFKKSPISPLVGFEKWINSQGKTLIIDEEFYALVAEQAYKLNTGARSLQTILNNIRTPLIKEVFRGTSNTIHLGMKNMIGNNKQKINRKGKL